MSQLRAEAAQARTELKRVQEALKAHEDAKLSDSEKQQKRLQELEEENVALLSKVRDGEVLAAVARSGAVHPEVVAKLVNPAVDNLAAELERLRKAYPTLFSKGKGSADGAPVDPPAPRKDMNEFIRASAGRG